MSTIHLINLDIGSNFITGTLPDVLFTGAQNLESISVSKNCLSVVLSDIMCQSPNLIVLAMDGWNAQCYSQQHQLSGGEIPECLYNMPRLKTLHLSGNSLTGEW